MKLRLMLRLAFTVLTFMVSFALLQKRKSGSAKSSAVKVKAGDVVNESNTDFIFFEALSKYLFLSLR